MNQTDEKKATRLLNRLVKIMSQVNALEKTFSRLKSEAEELLRKLLKRND